MIIVNLDSADDVRPANGLLLGHLHHPWHWLSGNHSTHYFFLFLILASIHTAHLKVTIMGFLGCCGAWKESPWMLGTVSHHYNSLSWNSTHHCSLLQFFAFLMIIFFGEVASGVLVYYQVSCIMHCSRWFGFLCWSMTNGHLYFTLQITEKIQFDDLKKQYLFFVLL